jgi:hypothetical protein
MSLHSLYSRLPLRSYLAHLLICHIADHLFIHQVKGSTVDPTADAFVDRGLLTNISALLQFICFSFFKDKHHRLLLDSFSNLLGKTGSCNANKKLVLFSSNGLPFSVQTLDDQVTSSSLYCSSSIYLAIFLFHTCTLLLETLLSIVFDFRFTPFGINGDIVMSKRWISGLFIDYVLSFYIFNVIFSPRCSLGIICSWTQRIQQKEIAEML